MSIADEKYVSFTTFRRSGDPLATPVRIAPMNKGSAETAATARMVGQQDAEFDEVRAAVKRKYGVAFTLITTAGKINQVIRRGNETSPDGVVVIDLTS